ncbi:MAG TPA: hypothetical protein VGB14_15270 [Acidimicrobiales bacterium]
MALDGLLRRLGRLGPAGATANAVDAVAHARRVERVVDDLAGRLPVPPYAPPDGAQGARREPPAA